MKKISIFLFSALLASGVFAESYSVNDILNTKIDYKQNADRNDSSELNKFCIYSSKYNPCYEQNDSKNSFLKWQEGQRTLERDRQTLYLGTNKLYSILKKDYGLESKVKCRIYNSNPIRDDLRAKYGISAIYDPSLPTTQVLGEENQDVMRMDSSLNKDIFNELLSVSMLNSPSITPEKKKYYIYEFQQKHIAIEKSCGEKFITAYNKYLDDYGKYTAEIQKNEQIQKNEEKRLKANERELAIKQKDEEERRYQQSILLATQQKEQKYKVEEEAKAMCYRSKQYLMYKASNEIVYAVDSVNAGQKLLQQDDANIKVGGVSNMTQRYRASSMINTGNQALKKSFAEYKQLGGTVSTPYQVKKITNSPCR